MRRLKIAGGISLVLVFTPLALIPFADSSLAGLGLFLFLQYPAMFVDYVAGDQGRFWMAGVLAWVLWSALTYAVLWLVVDVPVGDRRRVMIAARYVFTLGATLAFGWALLSSGLTLVVFVSDGVPSDLTLLQFIVLGPLTELMSTWRAWAIGAVMVLGWRLLVREYSASVGEGEPA